MKRLVILCMLTLLCVSSVSALTESPCTKASPNAQYDTVPAVTDTLSSGMVFCLLYTTTWHHNSVIDPPVYWDQPNKLKTIAASQGFNVLMTDANQHSDRSTGDAHDYSVDTYGHFLLTGGSGGGGGGSVRKL